jgi:hypothetical protein
MYWKPMARRRDEPNRFLVPMMIGPHTARSDSSYSADDMGRIASANCGSIWSQTFGYDPFGNLTKSGSISWMPGYNSSTNRSTLSGTSNAPRPPQASARIWGGTHSATPIARGSTKPARR